MSFVAAQVLKIGKAPSERLDKVLDAFNNCGTRGRGILREILAVLFFGVNALAAEDGG
jgi:hypothetical protein